MNKLSVIVPERPAPAAGFDVADLIVSYLEQIGVEYVFGIPGGAVEPLYNALARSARRGGPRHVLARHEAGAAFMADGYARESGKIGVCIATSGPGATNLITGVACAYDNSIPLLAITGQPALPAIGRRAFQDSTCTGVNVLGMFEHCTRYNSLVSHPDQAETKLVSALSRAWHTPRGPAHLSIPVDILRSRCTSATPAYDLQSLLMSQRTLLDHAAVKKLARELKRAQRTVFLIGGDCADAIDTIFELVHITKAVFVTTPDAKGLVNTKDPNYRGVFGFAGHESAEALLKTGPDLIVAFGTHLGEWTSGGWCKTLLNDRLVHVDACEEHLMRTPMARLHVRGHIRTVCDSLIGMMNVQGKSVARTDKERKTMLRDSKRTLQEPDKYVSDEAPIKPQRLMRELSRLCPPNTRFVADTGNSTSWAVHYLELDDRRLMARRLQTRAARGRDRRHNCGWLRVTMDFAPMGWAIGAAVGIARAQSGCPVVCITGDGSYLMNGQEISVAAEEQLPVLFVILNDGALGMVKHGQQLAGAESIANQLPQVDFRMLARAMKVPGYVIREPADLAALDFEAILKRKGPTLLDVRIDADEVPPMGVRMRVLGTAGNG
jgi:acetolactate synthase-1/2/3 large subunit